MCTINGLQLVSQTGLERRISLTSILLIYGRTGKTLSRFNDKSVMEVNSSNAQVHFSVNLIISGVVELYRNVGGGIFTLEDEEVCYHCVVLCKPGRKVITFFFMPSSTYHDISTSHIFLI